MCSVLSKLISSIAGDVVGTDVPPLQGRACHGRRHVDCGHTDQLRGKGFFVDLFVFVSPVDGEREWRTVDGAHDLESHATDIAYVVFV